MGPLQKTQWQKDIRLLNHRWGFTVSSITRCRMNDLIDSIKDLGVFPSTEAQTDIIPANPSGVPTSYDNNPLSGAQEGPGQPGS